MKMIIMVLLITRDKIEIEAIYDDIDYLTDDYPIVLARYSGDKLLVNLSTGKELPIKINSDRYNC